MHNDLQEYLDACLPFAVRSGLTHVCHAHPSEENTITEVI